MAEQSYGDWIRSNPPLPTKEYKHMAQQTAVEWLDRWYRDNPEATHEEGNKALEQAKRMHKQQTVDAYKHGQKNEFSHVMVGKILITGEEYYEQTYKTQAQ